MTEPKLLLTGRDIEFMDRVGRPADEDTKRRPQMALQMRFKHPLVSRRTSRERASLEDGKLVLAAVEGAGGDGVGLAHQKEDSRRFDSFFLLLESLEHPAARTPRVVETR